jgi:hypothetical protein
MAVSVKLSQLARSIEGVQQWPYKAVADAMEVIPRTLAQNAGASPIRVLTQLRAKHVEGHTTWGLDGDTGKLVDMKEYGVWEPEAVKLQSIKTSIMPLPYHLLTPLSSLHACSSVSTISAAASLRSRLATPVVVKSDRHLEMVHNATRFASGCSCMNNLDQ